MASLRSPTTAADEDEEVTQVVIVADTGVGVEVVLVGSSVAAVDAVVVNSEANAVGTVALLAASRRKWQNLSCKTTCTFG